jgi:hypothetical protein
MTLSCIETRFGLLASNNGLLAVALTGRESYYSPLFGDLTH